MTRLYWWLFPIGLIVLLDEWLKFLALERLPLEGSLVDPGVLAFAIHKNYGVAFNIPFKLEFVIVVSIALGVFLLREAWQNRTQSPWIAFSCLVIVLGALGNLYDRVVYSFTVDYLILFGRSAINLSDIVIVSGVGLLLYSGRNVKR